MPLCPCPACATNSLPDRLLLRPWSRRAMQLLEEATAELAERPIEEQTVWKRELIRERGRIDSAYKRHLARYGAGHALVAELGTRLGELQLLETYCASALVQ